MRGHKRFRNGAWRLVVAAPNDPLTGRRRNIYETVHEPDNRAGAKLADARLAELIVAVSSGHVTANDLDGQPAARCGPTVADLARDWQAANQPRQEARTGRWVGWSPKTAVTVAGNFRLHILPAIGNYLADQVTGLHLDRFYRSLEVRTGLSPSAVQRCHGQLRAMFNWAVRKRLMVANPALSADPPRVKARHLQVPTMSQVRSVQDVARPAFASFLQLAATVGARRGTLVALRWRDVDLERSTITFSRAIAESADGDIEKGTKADRAYTVSLGPATAQLLREHRRRAAEAALAVGRPLDGDCFVFSDDGGTAHWDLSWPSHAWKHYSTMAGLPGWRLHDLRHTAASQMLMAGVPIAVVAERLGCTEVNILRTYRHFIPGSDRGAAELMDRLLAGSPLQ
ncbi:MAG TPA: site-specific integrase [Acidimicrobiales bacterium]|nr:site-specific integrase [Acidimicrobiales bacterium]